MLMNLLKFFLPIFQLGCFKAKSGLILAILFFDLFKNGPPDAVNIIFSIFFEFSFFINFQMEKCSESSGMNFVSYFNNFFLIKSQPHIIDSLLEINKFLVYGMIFKVGSRPSIPVIEFTQYDT